MSSAGCSILQLYPGLAGVGHRGFHGKLELFGGARVQTKTFNFHEQHLQAEALQH